MIEIESEFHSTQERLYTSLALIIFFTLPISLAWSFAENIPLSRLHILEFASVFLGRVDCVL